MLGVGKRLNHSILRKSGIFVKPHALTPSECERLCSEARTQELDPATVSRLSTNDQTLQVYEQARRTKYVRISSERRTTLEDRFQALRPEVEAFFDCQLDRCFGTQLLAYEPGDFFRAHQDVPHDPNQPCAPEIRRRKVSAILFLNAQAKNPKQGEYGGGSLIFQGLLDGKGAQGSGISVVPEPGLFVAFLSTVWHRVDEVTAGTRYTLVTWFESAAGEKASAAGA